MSEKIWLQNQLKNEQKSKFDQTTGWISIKAKISMNLILVYVQVSSKKFPSALVYFTFTTNYEVLQAKVNLAKNTS